MGAASLLVLALAVAPLLDAVKTGDREVALKLIAASVDVNAADPDGTTALIWAASRNDTEVALRLLAAGAAATTKNAYGATALAEAARYGNVELVAALLKAGADVESASGDGQTALMLVARTGKVEAARLLVDSGANVNAREGWKGQTALMWAAAQRHPAMVSFLIGAKAEVDARAIEHDWQRQVTGEPRAVYRPAGGQTALLFATREGCIECATALLDAGADIDLGDPESVTPLLMAVTNGHFDLAATLIDRGADIQAWDWWGRTPLYAAVDLHDLPHGGRPDGPRPDTTTSLQLMEKLLVAGANPNPQLKLLPPYRSLIDDRAMDAPLVTGATPLVRAAKGFDVAAVALLLKHGADVHLANVRGMTPVMLAAGLGSTDADSRGLYTTKDVQARSMATLELLIAAGGDVNGKDGGRGLTALHEAARWGWDDVVTLLVAKGADVKATDARGMTPVDSALGRAGGNGRFSQRIDRYEKTAALLKSLGGVEGTPKGPTAAGPPTVGRDMNVPTAPPGTPGAAPPGAPGAARPAPPPVRPPGAKPPPPPR